VAEHVEINNQKELYLVGCNQEIILPMHGHTNIKRIHYFTMKNSGHENQQTWAKGCIGDFPQHEQQW